MKNVALLTDCCRFALFFRPPPPGGIWQLKSPQPREFAIQGRKKLCPGVGGVGFLGARRSWNWSDLKYVSLTVLKRADITEKAVSPFQFFFLFLFSSFKEGGRGVSLLSDFEDTHEN